MRSPSTLFYRRPLDGRGKLTPRRKYGRLRKPIPPLTPEKCRFCRLGRPCPAHPRSTRSPATGVRT